MNAKKCDRCGTYYEAWYHYEKHDPQFNAPFDQIRLLKGVNRVSDPDLCPKCIDELAEWLANRTTVPNKRTVIANPSTTQRFTERKVKSIENGIVTYYDE